MNNEYHLRKKNAVMGIGSFLTGIAFGAAAVILTDPVKRGQIKEKMSDLFEKTGEKLDQMKQKVDETKDQSKKIIAEQLGNMSDRLSEKKYTSGKK